MPISDYLRGLRARVGGDLLLVPSVSGVVLDAAGRVLLVRHANGNVWVIPGGAVDPDENPADAVVREVWEETGVHVVPTGLLGVFGGPEFRVRYANGDETAYVMATFECRPLGGALRPDGEETLEVRYVAASELASLHLPEWMRIVLPPILDGHGKAWTPVKWAPPSR
jgi:8-oxo-dGTP pyrophosphatase MutT (NUDIX family)